MRNSLALIAAGLVLTGGPALAQTAAPAPTPAPAPSYSSRVVTLAEAKTVVAAAEAEARKNGWTMVIVILESNGQQVFAEKMDGTQYGSNEVALKKAHTSANFRRPTSYFQDAVKAGTLNSIFTGATAVEGGELLLVDGKIVGSIGVSGGSGAQDGQVARAGAAALK
ncbi:MULTISPECIES: heme-binding protein [unclassified Caulobacter]|uniref:GlcG/HbpS family heme-binding protein n=1 Tax=unclassified Caulobacter TaxID=2648921 RepID=UPI0006FB71A1|nr:MULTISPECIES: heme-binding protein [unclassified Caulobacter]KQV56665.1 glcG protein [Caulobacter sp. Root342]KQV72302.1 glcG protein [Caulobacter sp. Root343]